MSADGSTGLGGAAALPVNVAAALTQAAEQVALARQQIASGRSAAIANLPDEIAHLCGVAQTLPQELHGPLGSLLAGLIGELDHLRDEILAQRAARGGGEDPDTSPAPEAP